LSPGYATSGCRTPSAFAVPVSIATPKVARRLGVKKGGSKYLGGKIAFLEIPWGYNEDAMGYACPPVSYMARSEILEQTMEVHRHRWENHPAIMEVNAEFSSKPWS